MHIPRTHTDVGLHALDIIHRVLMIDAEWTSQANREFTWLGQRPAQRVTASPCSESREILISRIRVSVPLLDDVRMSAAEFDESPVFSIEGDANRVALAELGVH